MQSTPTGTAAATATYASRKPPLAMLPPLSTKTWNNLSTTPVPTTATTSSITSLFTLHHPLEDVLPVTLINDNTKETFLSLLQHQAMPVTDVFEYVLWTGTAEWLDTSINNNKDTKHTANRHNRAATARAHGHVPYSTQAPRHLET